MDPKTSFNSESGLMGKRFYVDNLAGDTHSYSLPTYGVRYHTALGTVVLLHMQCARQRASFQSFMWPIVVISQHVFRDFTANTTGTTAQYLLGSIPRQSTAYKQAFGFFFLAPKVSFTPSSLYSSCLRPPQSGSRSRQICRRYGGTCAESIPTGY